MTKNQKLFVASILNECLESAYRGGSSETQEQIEKAISILNSKPEIEIHVEGGVIQDVNIPKEVDVKVVIKDYDCNEDDGSEFIKEDEHGLYWEAIYENGE